MLRQRGYGNVRSLPVGNVAFGVSRLWSELGLPFMLCRVPMTGVSCASPPVTTSQAL